MDVVLELFDTFLFDPIYAKLLPLSNGAAAIDPVSTIVAGIKSFADLNNASTTLNNVIATAATGNGWEYTPASSWLSIQPSDYAYMSRLTRDNVLRQLISLYIITWIFGLVIYFVCASLSYVFIFDKETFKHPKYLKNQMSLEIRQTMHSIPIMAIFTVPLFLAEVRGFTFIYDTIPTAGFSHPILSYFGWTWNWLQFPVFLLFTDFCIYWIHRGLHHPILYKRLHKPHHKWIMPTPFASHAFHPIDGFAQSVPYHFFPFILPLQKFAYVALFVFINIWTVLIHDGEYVANSPIINGAACHTMHHLYFNYNYGQYTTLWDRLGGSYRKPNMELFIKETKMSTDEWKRQTTEMERMVKEVEGKDDRSYEPETDTKKSQ